MAFLTLAELQARCPGDSYLRAFRRVEDELSAATDAYAQLCLDDADSEIRMRIDAYLSSQPDFHSAVDNAIKRHVAAVALFNGVALSPSSAGAPTSPFEPAYKRAMDFFDRLAAGVKNQPVVSAARSLDTATTQNTLDDAGQPTRPYGEAADRISPRSNGY